MCEIIILVISHPMGSRTYYEFRSYADFMASFEFIKENTYLQSAILKGKFWEESKNFDKLKAKIKRMHW